jgi:hypothetical protein
MNSNRVYLPRINSRISETDNLLKETYEFLRARNRRVQEM